MLAIVLVCAVLTYGGVSLFVVVFAAYPFAAEMFRAGNIPKRLIPGTIALGAFSFTMDSLPCSPQIQNIIPTTYFKTDDLAPRRCSASSARSSSSSSAWPISNGAARQAPPRARAMAKATSTSRRRSTDPRLAPAFIAFLPLIVVFVVNICSAVSRPVRSA